MPSTVSNGNGSTSQGEEKIPHGNYVLVGWDMDSTGRKLIDEICQIAGYTSKSNYSQYVMPYKNLNPSAKKRHGLKIITITRYRMLKDIKSNKIVATKSEISALTEFLDWLETIKGDSYDGVILVYHELRKVLPIMLLESLKRWKLLDRFKKIVTGFANSCDIVKKRNKNSDDASSMRILARTLLNKDVDDDALRSAAVRALHALEIVETLAVLPESPEDPENLEDVEESVCKESSEAHVLVDPVEFVRQYVETVEEEENKHAELKIVLQRETTLKPIFASLLCKNRRERQLASPLRRLLAESKIEYTHLQEAWNKNKLEELEKLLKEKIADVTAKDIEALLQIFESHFDENKAQELKLEKEKFSAKKTSEKKSARVKLYSHNTSSNNIDSGNESVNASLIQSPTTEVQAPGMENIAEVLAVQ